MTASNPKGNHATKRGGNRQKRVALYVRVSSDEQARGESIADQLQSLRRYADEHGYLIVGEFLDEGYSAKKSYKTRPAMKELLASVERREPELILFTRLDRWFRSVKDYWSVQEILEKNGCNWQATTEDFDDMTSTGIFKIQMVLALSEHESNRLGDRMRFTFQEKRARGEYIGGTLPMGYKAVNKKIVKDEAIADAVSEMFRVYLQTKCQKDALAAGAAMGYVKEQQLFSRMLHKCSKTHAGTVSGVPAEPYITLEQAAEIEASVKTHGRMPKADFIFSGLLYCKDCGRRMSGHNNRRHAKSTARTKSYNCQNRYFFYPPLCSNSINVREAEIESRLLQIIEPELSEYRAKALLAQHKSPQSDTSKTRQRIEAKKARLLDAYLDGAVEKDVYRAKKEQLEIQLASLPKEETPTFIPPALPENWREVYEQLTPSNRREFWRSILSSISIDKNRLLEINFIPL